MEPTDQRSGWADDKTKDGFKWTNLINAQGNALVDWKIFLSNDMGTPKARKWWISRGKSMLKRITDAIARSRQTLEDEDTITSENDGHGLLMLEII